MAELDLGLERLCRRRRCEDEIVATQGVTERSINKKTKRSIWLQLDRIAGLGESHEADQLVIGIVAPAKHLQGEIDFRPSDLAQRRHHAGTLAEMKLTVQRPFWPVCVRSAAAFVSAGAGRPDSIFCLSVTTCSSSGFSVSACCH